MYPYSARRIMRMCALCMAVGMAGCATRLPYVAPSSGALSRLLIRGNSFVPGRYVVDTFDDAKTCKAPKTIAEAVSGKFDVSTTIKGGQETSLRLTCNQNMMMGSYIVTFDAKPDHKYDVEPFSDGMACGMLIFEVSSGERILDPSARKRTVTPYLQGGFCASDKSTVVVKQRSQATELGDLVDLLPRNEGKADLPTTKAAVQSGK